MSTEEKEPVEAPPSAPIQARSIPAMPGEEEDKVERDGKLYLPVPHPLVHKPAPDSWGARLNKAWIETNYFFRGIYATVVEWAVSMMDLALEYPRIAVVSIAMGAVVCEEMVSKHPILSSTIKYVMFTVDPDAADVVFPPEVDPSEAEETVDKLAAEVVEGAAKTYYESPEYKELQLLVRQEMHTEVLARIESLSGIPAEALEKPEEPPAEEPKKRKRRGRKKAKVEEPIEEPAVPVEEPPVEELPPEEFPFEPAPE